LLAAGDLRNKDRVLAGQLLALAVEPCEFLGPLPEDRINGLDAALRLGRLRDLSLDLRLLATQPVEVALGLLRLPAQLRGFLAALREPLGFLLHLLLQGREAPLALLALGIAPLRLAGDLTHKRVALLRQPLNLGAKRRNLALACRR
jgi:hypothetical protein